MTKVTIYPHAEYAALLLTAKEPISHHDPSTGDGSNRLTFNRQKQMVRREVSDQPISPKLLEALLAANPMTEMVGELAKQLTLPEFIATALTRQFIDLYSDKDGVGLFSGVDRYTMLESRLKNAAIRSQKLHSAWSNLVDSLQVHIHFGKDDESIAMFWLLPQSIQYQVLAAIAENARSIISIARLWNRQMKGQSQDYVASFGGLFNPQIETIAEYEVADIASANDAMIIEIPAISANTIRHQMVRAPGWIFLAHVLGIAPVQRNKGEIPQGAEGIFVNGGNIAAGASQPSNAWKLAGEIREAFPHLDLVGGCTDSFDIGESCLSVSAWLVCKENAENLPESLQNTARAKMSAFDMLDEMTRTRQAISQGEIKEAGQMIYNYEVLAQGTQIYTEFSLRPETTPLTKGALLCALNTFAGTFSNGISVVGGQSARGHGHVNVEWSTELDDSGQQQQYINYVTENAEQLREWIIDGTLGSGSIVVT
jgi:hypothetical protein